ncbi:hypothetical protein RBH26_07760 [Natronolimnohabitans sp. A-GB9]|uniref:hypothetical protein n=1 Tax=Natronolimnohabitans sp. A-GB9 TaxID=3069757 RepID=UPI0027AE03D5|nr:hypothetical protein [Natronolimnohabitans sp. A-GB9]MDQ2050380.1 hypothetical protein [Natronolimnohabitans sp. A-GB9]
MDRRSILKTVGTGIGATAFAGMATAAPTDGDHLEKLEISTEKLKTGETRRLYSQARSSPAGEAMEAFLVDEQESVNGRGNSLINTKEMTGMRITGSEIPEHVRLKAPLRSSRGELQDYIELRVLQNDAVTAEALVNDRAYKTNPSLLSDNQDIGTSSGSSDSNQEVMTAIEWYQEMQSSGPSIANATSCGSSWTFENNSAACQLLSGLTVIAGAVLTIIPEPGTTAIGTVSIAGVLSGSCTVIDAVDQMVDDCNVNEITICAYQPCWYCTPNYYAYPSDCT